MATLQNFMHGTFANFSKCERPDRAPDFVSGGGSQYWYEGSKVIRFSDHWCQSVASCAWFLDGEVHYGWEAGECDLVNFTCHGANNYEFMSKWLFEANKHVYKLIAEVDGMLLVKDTTIYCK